MSIYADRNSDFKNKNSKAGYSKSSDSLDKEVEDKGIDSNISTDSEISTFSSAEENYKTKKISQIQLMAGEAGLLIKLIIIKIKQIKYINFLF